MADLSGLSRGDLSRIETGRMLPLDKWLEAIEEAYGAPPEEWYPPEVLLVVRYPEGA